MISNIHRGPYIQHGHGFGGIFRSVMSMLRPLFSKGIKLGKHALKDPQIKSAISDIKKSAVKSGTKALTNKMETLSNKNDKQSFKRAKKRVAHATNKHHKKRKITNKTIFS